jgi:hypothetical protein
VAWKVGLEPALKACGFRVIRMDLVQHNDNICDRILAEIRSSNLLVADFTGIPQVRPRIDVVLPALRDQ